MAQQQDINWLEFQQKFSTEETCRCHLIYYNDRRRHGSLGNTSPKQYYNALKNKEIETASFTA